MPRIRYIKPEFFTDEHIAELPYPARLVFQGLWCYADREGRLEDKAKFLKVALLPYDSEDMEKILEQLNTGEKPFINRYQINGKSYIQIINFTKHQKPHHTEKNSIIPAISQESKRKDSATNREEKIKRMEKGMGSVHEASRELKNGEKTVNTPLKGGNHPEKLPPENSKTDYESETAIQFIVRIFKKSLGIPETDKAWDKSRFGRCARAASEIIAAFDGDEKYATAWAAHSIQKWKAWAEKNGKSFSLERIAQAAQDDKGKYLEMKSAEEKKNYDEQHNGEAVGVGDPDQRERAGGLAPIGSIAAGAINKIRPT